MPASGITIDAIDPSALHGLVVESVVGWRSDPPRQRQGVTVPGVPGQIVRGQLPEIPPRRLVVRGVVFSTSGASAQQNVEQIQALCRFGSAERTLILTVMDRVGQQIIVTCDAFEVGAPAAQFVARELPVEITFTAWDPFWYDAADTTVPNIGGQQALPQGTAPTWPLIVLGNTWTNPVLTLRDSAGVTVATLGFTVAFGPGSSFEIDMAKKTVRLGGVNNIHTITSGNFFEVDVNVIGNFRSSQWPSIQVSGAGGGATGWAQYKKAWR
jgi:hypothetical protein